MQEKKIQLPKSHYTGIKRGELSKPLFIQTIFSNTKTKCSKFIYQEEVLFQQLPNMKNASSTLLQQLRGHLSLCLDSFQIIPNSLQKDPIQCYSYRDLEYVLDNVSHDRQFLMSFYPKEKNSTIGRQIRVICNSLEQRDIFVYLFRRGLATSWQQQFQKKLDFKLEDPYQFHVFVMKYNSRNNLQPRFIVLSKKWMCNLKMVLLPIGFVYQKNQWKVPIQAVKSAQVSKPKGVYDQLIVKVFLDKDIQNTILLQNKMKKIPKVERKYQFHDFYTCRLFVFHLRRLHKQITGYIFPIQ